MRLVLLTVALGYITYCGIQDRKAGRKTWRTVLLPYVVIGLAILVAGFVASVLFGTGIQW
jgi:hypothetical protein